MFKILVIDDDWILRTLLQRSLKEYEVITASNGKEGLEKAHAHHPALIICDWMMPGEFDGVQVCRLVKADPKLAASFFILLTGRSNIVDRVLGLDSGADDFLVKPVEVTELKARVRAVVRLHQATQDLKQLAEDLKQQKHILETELAEAAAYVRSLLPNPLREHLQIDCQFLPSRQLGGDCFDYYWLDQEHLVLYLLDMSGHGLGSALPSISIQNLLRSKSLKNVSFDNPKMVLDQLNEVFQMGEHHDRYFTIWYGVYNRTKQELTYASAGHPPAILITKPNDALERSPLDPLEGKSIPGLEVRSAKDSPSTDHPDNYDVQLLRTPGLPIGMMPDVKYINQSCHIPSGSTLYLFSDGIYEIEQQDGEFWNLQEFIKFLRTDAITATADLGEIFQHVLTLTGADSFDDDCSLVRVQFPN